MALHNRNLVNISKDRTQWRPHPNAYIAIREAGRLKKGGISSQLAHRRQRAEAECGLLPEFRLPNSIQKVSRKRGRVKSGDCAQTFCDSLGGHLNR